MVKFGKFLISHKFCQIFAATKFPLHTVAEIHNLFSKLFPCFSTNHKQTFRDYVSSINESNMVLYDLPTKAFRSKPVKFKTLQDLHLSYMENDIPCYMRC